LPSCYAKRHYSLQAEPFELQMKDCSNIRTNNSNDNVDSSSTVKVTFHFMGHYQEPPLNVQYRLNLVDTSVTFRLTYFPLERKWLCNHDQKSQDINSTSNNNNNNSNSNATVSGLEQDLMDTHQPRVNLANAKWQFVSTGGQVPSPTTWPAAVFAQVQEKNKMFLFGGASSRGGSNSFTGVSTLDFESNQWTRVLPTSERWGHSASIVSEFDPLLVWLFGGWDSKSQYNDLQLYNIKDNSLTPRQTRGDIPSHRSEHSAVVVGKTILIFGGSCCTGGPYTFFNDVYALDVALQTWTKVECRGNVPPPRAQHSATVIGKVMLVIGGCNSMTTFDDVYALDLTTNLWSKIQTKGSSGLVAERLNSADFRVNPVRHCACLLSDGSTLVIHGDWGCSALDADTLTWKKVQTEICPKRACHVACSNEADSLWVFGGSHNHESFNSVYRLCF